MINKMLKVERGERVFPGRNVAAFAEIEVRDSGSLPNIRKSFSNDSEYTMYLKVGVDFVSNDAELDRKTDAARKQLMHALFKDVISELYEIGNLDQYGELSSRVYSLIDRLQNA